MVMLMGQSRVFFSMSKDGLLPKVFSDVHPKYKTPSKSNFLFMIFVSLFAAFVPANVVGEMTSIGTLLAFILVCVGVMVLRKKQPDFPRAFKTPLVPLVPILGVAACLFMMLFLPLDTWLRLIIWMLIGIDIYLMYGTKNSKLANEVKNESSLRPLFNTGFILSFLLAVVAVLHHLTLTEGTEDTILFWSSIIIAGSHLIYYIAKMVGNKK
jgi:basic amino acid/polyamine antiporter, APA family